jgi:hypothetical protein
MSSPLRRRSEYSRDESGVYSNRIFDFFIAASHGWMRPLKHQSQKRPRLARHLCLAERHLLHETDSISNNSPRTKPQYSKLSWKMKTSKTRQLSEPSATLLTESVGRTISIAGGIGSIKSRSMKSLNSSTQTRQASKNNYDHHWKNISPNGHLC